MYPVIPTATFMFDLTIIIYSWFITFLLQLIAAPFLLLHLNQHLRDAGWAISRVLGWLVIGLIIWVLAHFQVPLNTTIGFWSVILILLGLSLKFSAGRLQQLKRIIHQRRWLIFASEALFLIGFVFLSIVRTHNPHILDLEKFMDAGFMASYLRAATLPAPDIWLAGETINYYSFGHFLGSLIARLWHLPIAYSYNLLLGFIMGLGLMLSFSVVVNLIHNTLDSTTDSKLIASGIVSSLLVIVGGNTHTLWYLLSRGSWEGYWYADATRFIHHTIHEFPSYSFVVSDLHAHVWSLPLVLTFLVCIIVWVKQLNIPHHRTKPFHWLKQHLLPFNKQHLLALPHPPGYIITAGILGIILGTFIMTSAWDLPIYSVLLLILGLLLVISYPRSFTPLFLSAIIILATALLTALLWLIHFTSISEGIALVTERSPIWQLLALWSNHLAISLIALITLIYLTSHTTTAFRQRTLLLVAAIIFTAWTLLIIPELVYVKDIYSGHPRANTMFKLTYQGFVLMGLSGGWVVGALLHQTKIHILARRLGLLILIFPLATNLLFPYFAYRDYYHRLNRPQGLFGYRWLQEENLDDFAAIQFLQRHIRGQPVILEAVGESYTKHNRVSSITGLPTVLGWRVHEWLWRGGFDIPGERTEEVRTMYETPLSHQAAQLLNKYRVEYIFIGEKEYETYSAINVNALTSLGDVIFSQGRTYIIHRQL